MLNQSNENVLMKKNNSKLTQLSEMMAQLRDQDAGCKWCQQQTWGSLTRYTIEEAYEVNAAVIENNPLALKDELADLLLQVLFYSQIATEQQLFDFDDVCQALIEKLKRRNPHVFQQPTKLTIPELEQQWLRIKEEEKANQENQGWLGGIPASLPPLLRSEKIQSRSAQANLDWECTEAVIEALHDEINELEQAHQQQNHQETIAELGDIVFTCVNLARHLDTNVETALHLTNEKFLRRFRYIEKALQQEENDFQNLSFQELLIYWNQAKQEE